MTTFSQLRSLLLAPGGQCAAMCAVGLALSLVPVKHYAPARAIVERGVAPVCSLLAPAAATTADCLDQLADGWQRQTEIAQLQARIDALQEANRDLAWKLRSSIAESGSNQPFAPQQERVQSTPPLLQARLVEARVLGRQGRSYLAQHDLLHIGSPGGAAPDALVLDPKERQEVLLDVGAGAGLQPNQHVLAGGEQAYLVWGKLVQVGEQTSTLRRATDAGYRDLVQLAHVTADGLRLGARGVLEGDGASLCRLTRVESAEPVEVGDLVLTSDTAGLVAASPQSLPRLVYGAVLRVEKGAAEKYWSIWVQPAVSDERQPTVAAVVTQAFHPERIASAQVSTGASSEEATR